MTATASPPARTTLAIEGMTCASCAVRIEKKLNKLEGVQATVNFATEKAAVEFDPALVAPGELVAAVEQAGYHATLPTEARAEAAEADPAAALRFRLLVTTALSLPVVLLVMVPSLQFDAWQWLSLQLATPVVLWGGWPFHRAAALNLRHGTATMDTLISVGTLAAWGWSAVSLFFLDAGDPGMRMEFAWSLGAATGGGDLYLEVGDRRHRPDPARPFLRGARQAQGRRRDPRAARARREGGRRARAGRRRAARADRAARRRRPVRRPAGREGRDRRDRRGGLLRGGHVAADGRERPGRGRARGTR